MLKDFLQLGALFLGALALFLYGVGGVAWHIVSPETVPFYLSQYFLIYVAAHIFAVWCVYKTIKDQKENKRKKERD